MRMKMKAIILHSVLTLVCFADIIQSSKKTQEGIIMIILEKHFEGKDIAIYRNIVSFGLQTFHIDRLNEFCKWFSIGEKVKQSILDSCASNKGKDDPTQNILATLREVNNRTLNHAVALGTQNLDLLKSMCEHFDRECLSIVAKREDVDDSITEYILKKATWDIRYIVAERKILSNKIIHQLAEDDKENVRYVIAQRKDLDNELILKLNNDTSEYVRWAIAGQENLSDELVHQLADDNMDNVRCIIAGRKSLSHDLIVKLSKDQYWGVRKKIANRPNLSHEIVEQLAKDECEYVRFHIANRNDLSDKLIKQLAQDESEHVRDAIANKFA